jgi:hypothetical protein
MCVRWGGGSFEVDKLRSMGQTFEVDEQVGGSRHVL